MLICQHPKLKHPTRHDIKLPPRTLFYLHLKKEVKKVNLNFPNKEVYFVRKLLVYLVVHKS